MNDFLEKYRKLIVTGLLAVMFLLSFFAMMGDSAIVDEIAHIPAGYSYVKFGDYRLNPEHPPLIKDLAGLPLLLLNLSFPSDHISWTKDVNGQWEAGWNFLYHYGNSPDLILLFSRLPILLLAALFGLLIYSYVRRNWGTKTALLALFFYSLSPNFLAHNHLVTTDLGIAFFIFLSLATFADYLRNPTRKTGTYAILALAGAELAKFSAVLLIPFYFLLVALVIFFRKSVPTGFNGLKKFKTPFTKKLYGYGLSFILIMILTFGLIWLFYIPHTMNFPADKQIELIKTSLPDNRVAFIKNFLITLSGNSFTKPIAQYLLGVTMVFGRVSGGNTTFFFGEVSNQSFKWYFPASYLLKEPLSFIFFFLLALVASAAAFFRKKIPALWRSFKLLLEKNPERPIFLMFTIYYAGISVAGNLNLGIRHLFPILPLIYVLVAQRAVNFFSGFRSRAGKISSLSVFVLLVLWYTISSLAAFPNYIAYFNELIGGGKNAYLYFTDSNVDWGQDLKRLAAWTKEHPEVEKLKLDYFGGGEPKYYFCARKYDSSGKLVKTSSGYDCSKSVYQEWHSKNGQTKGWIAVSVTFLQNAKFYAQRFNEPDYDWLRWREPYAKIGNSIFVYWVR